MALQCYQTRILHTIFNWKKYFLRRGVKHAKAHARQVSPSDGGRLFRRKKACVLMLRRRRNDQCLCACANPKKKPSLFAMVHAAIVKPKCAREHGPRFAVWFRDSVGF